MTFVPSETQRADGVDLFKVRDRNERKRLVVGLMEEETPAVLDRTAVKLALGHSFCSPGWRKTRNALST